MESERSKFARRGIYFLPNLFTTAALFAGFYAIVAATQNKFEIAAIAIFVAMILDGLDGRVARWTNTESDFGAQYDSLSDMVSFGLAPALVMYEWALRGMGKVGWMAAFIYTAAAALRLARFNTQVGVADKRYFQGLPSPSAAAMVSGFVWLGHVNDVVIRQFSLVAMVVTVVAGLLMVSNVRYHSFKGFDFRSKVPFIAVVAVALIIAVLFTDPPAILFGVFLLYALSGPVLTLWQLRHKRTRRKGAATHENKQDLEKDT